MQLVQLHNGSAALSRGESTRVLQTLAPTRRAARQARSARRFPGSLCSGAGRLPVISILYILECPAGTDSKWIPADTGALLHAKTNLTNRLRRWVAPMRNTVAPCQGFHSAEVGVTEIPLNSTECRDPCRAMTSLKSRGLGAHNMGASRYRAAQAANTPAGGHVPGCASPSSRDRQFPPDIPSHSTTIPLKHARILLSLRKWTPAGPYLWTGPEGRVGGALITR